MPLAPLEKALQVSERWMVECASLLDGLTFPTTNRLRVAITLQHLCVEHYQGVHVLIDQGVIGSAFALLRPQLDAYVRGVWFHHCASEEQIKAFLDGGDPPGFRVLIEAIEKIDGFDCAGRRDVGDLLSCHALSGVVSQEVTNVPWTLTHSKSPQSIWACSPGSVSNPV